MPERLDRITIVDHDPTWAASFEEQRLRLEAVLGDLLTDPIAHIGSTAVPGLAAKPIIDMLAVTDDHADLAPVLPALAGIGWVHAPEPGDAENRKWSLCHPDIARRTHHLHVVERRSDGWREWLAFRDHLRADAGARDAYAALKRRLAAENDRDRPRYRAGKAGFIRGAR
ncbi:GrpB family protein [Polymorphospora sp. NPDC051019]|uniref:GrpB family protein n=1 Tax=Polymorphospora sp. NPDC051019 TaxID=3155725 RepID=UPI003440A914